MKRLRTRPCSLCGGSGVQPATDIGDELKQEREKAGVSRRAMARALGITNSYLIDLERGTRGQHYWSVDTVADYREKLTKLTNGRRT